MEYCYDKGYKNSALVWNFILCTILGLSMGIIGIFELTNVEITKGVAASYFIYPILFYLFLGFLLFSQVIHMRKYKVDETGVTIRYLMGITKFYSWESFSEIALCKVHYRTKGPVHYELAIRCVVGPEKYGPKHATVANEWWSRPEYEVLHFKKIITIYYTEERFRHIQSMYPGSIADYCYLEDPC